MIKNSVAHVIFMSLMCLLLSVRSYAQVDGCTDPSANNFNPLATRNNGTCTYNNVTLSPALKSNLAADLIENSGIIYWNNRLWTHNDGGSPAELIEMDTTGSIIRKVSVSNATNNDWEDIAQDDNYVYIGDFGNNVSGNRTDLKIYRVSKADLIAGNSVTAEVINFSYEGQSDLNPVGANTTDFDCEAMIVYRGRIYLFLKQWSSFGTTVYELPPTPGTYIATNIRSSALPSNWLVTGADVMPDQRSVILCGYSTSSGSRFLYLLYDFTGTDFFSGNERIVGLNGFGQTEGIAFKNPEYIFISRERLTVSFFTFSQALETVNLTTLLKPYYQLLPIAFIKLDLTNSQFSTRIKWEIIPQEEFSSGWLQRRTGAQMQYQNVYALPEAKGWYDDAAQNATTYYRVKARDKDGNESYSREYRRVFQPSGETLVRTHDIIRASSANSHVVVYAMSGNMVASAAGEADISRLPAGTYYALCFSRQGEITGRIHFIR